VLGLPQLVGSLRVSAIEQLVAVGIDFRSTGGRPSIPQERLLKASLLIALYSVRSERALCEELDFQLLYRWFLSLCDRNSPPWPAWRRR
jgi:transposase